MLQGGGGIDPRMTAREVVTLHGRFHAAPRATDELLAEVGLSGDVARTRYRRLSGGERQRVGLAVALVGRPDLVVLDEPTAGMDVEARASTRDLLSRLRDSGVTVLLTSHDLTDVERVADRIAILDHGRIAALDTPAALKRTIAATEVVRLELPAPAPSNGGVAPVLERLGRVGTIAHSERQDGALLVTMHCRSARDFVPAAFDAARDAGTIIRHVEVVPVTLEDVFLSLTGRGLRE